MVAGSLFTRKLASSLGFLARSQSAKFHLSSNYGALKSSDGRFQVTLLPGDGVGPELMDSVQVITNIMTLKLKYIPLTMY